MLNEEIETVDIVLSNLNSYKKLSSSSIDQLLELHHSNSLNEIIIWSLQKMKKERLIKILKINPELIELII